MMPLKKELWRTPDILGFSAHWTWIWCVFWSSLFYPEGEGLIPRAGFGAISLEPLWTASLFANVAGLAALLFVTRFRNPLSDIRFLPQAAGIATTIGTLALSHDALTASSDFASILYVAGSLATGLGSGAVVALWGELFSSLGSKRTVSYSIISLLVAALAYAVLHLLPTGMAQIIVALLPCVSMACLIHFKHSLPKQEKKRRKPRNAFEAARQNDRGRALFRHIVRSHEGPHDAHRT